MFPSTLRTLRHAVILYTVYVATLPTDQNHTNVRVVTFELHSVSVSHHIHTVLSQASHWDCEAKLDGLFLALEHPSSAEEKSAL